MKRSLVLLFALALLAGCGGKKTHRAAPPPPATQRPPVATAQPQPAPATPETSLSQAERYRQAQDDGPREALDVTKIEEPEPKNEPPSRYGNRSPYNVLGRTYQVLPTSRGYVERGISSWYGNKFHGYMTSSFEPYDMYKFTAAHKSLPLPSWARVTNLETGKSVVVRVNDRGPFHGNRVIDLSQKSAHLLGFKEIGTARVKVEYVGRASLDGSDDTRLMATLRQGQPAPAPVQVASAGNVAMPGSARAAFNGPVPIPTGRPYNLGEPVSASLTDVTAAERAPRQVAAESSRSMVPATAPVRYDTRVGYLSGRGIY